MRRHSDVAPRAVFVAANRSGFMRVLETCPLLATSLVHPPDPPRTRTWNLRLRRPTPYPLGQRTAWFDFSESNQGLCTKERSAGVPVRGAPVMSAVLAGILSWGPSRVLVAASAALSCERWATLPLHHYFSPATSDPPRTRTWNLRLRRPTPYPFGQRTCSFDFSGHH